MKLSMLYKLQSLSIMNSEVKGKREILEDSFIRTEGHVHETGGLYAIHQTTYFSC
jgi:hypothetical protein